MTPANPSTPLASIAGRTQKIGFALLTALLSSGLAGCVMIGGSSRGGFFIWPGGLGLGFLLLLFFFLSRRR